MQSEYAQPFLGAKAWGGAGWATKGRERGTAPGGQHLLCAFIKGPAWWPGGGEDALLVHQEEPSPGAHPQVDYDSLVRSPVAECVLCALEQPFIFHLLWLGFSREGLPMEISMAGREGRRLIAGSKGPSVDLASLWAGCCLDELWFLLRENGYHFSRRC